MSRVSSPEALEPVLFAPPSIGDAELGEVMAVLRSGWLTTGPRVERFEREFAAYVGARYALAVNSCTAALHLSLLAAGIGPGDEVVTTPLTSARQRTPSCTRVRHPYSPTSIRSR